MRRELRGRGGASRRAAGPSRNLLHLVVITLLLLAVLFFRERIARQVAGFFQAFSGGAAPSAPASTPRTP